MHNEGSPFGIHQNTTMTTVTGLLAALDRIPDTENNTGRLQNPPIPHLVTAVQGGNTRLANVSFFSLGTSHTGHPRWPLGTALTTVPLKSHAHKQFLHSNKERNPLCSERPIKKTFSPHELTSPSPPVESCGSCCGPVGVYRKRQEDWNEVLYI